MDQQSIFSQWSTSVEGTSITPNRNGYLLMGWRAVCAGEKIGGRWTDQERRLHINCLELMAVFHAVQTSAKDKRHMVIQVHLDNTTAVAYINHLGGTKSPDSTSRQNCIHDSVLGLQILGKQQNLK